MQGILLSQAAGFPPKRRAPGKLLRGSVIIRSEEADVYNLLAPLSDIYAAPVLVKDLKAPLNLSEYAVGPDYGMIFHLHNSRTHVVSGDVQVVKTEHRLSGHEFCTQPNLLLGPHRGGSQNGVLSITHRCNAVMPARKNTVPIISALRARGYIRSDRLE